MDESDRYDAVPGRSARYLTDYARAVLQVFRQQRGGAASVDELAIAINERECVDADVTRVAIRLHQVTLPKLAAEGHLEYDSRSNTARFRVATADRDGRADGPGLLWMQWEEGDDRWRS